MSRLTSLDRVWGRLKQDKYIDRSHTKATAETFGWIWCAGNEMNSEESEFVFFYAWEPITLTSERSRRHCVYIVQHAKQEARTELKPSTVELFKIDAKSVQCFVPRLFFNLDRLGEIEHYNYYEVRGWSGNQKSSWYYDFVPIKLKPSFFKGSYRMFDDLGDWFDKKLCSFED